MPPIGHRGRTAGETVGETARLTLREAAERTGVPLDALRKRVYRGTVPAAKIDGQYTIAASDLDALGTDDGSTSALGETTGETGVGHGSDAGETPPDPIALDYIASLKDEIAFLRDQLDQRSRELAQERERSDVIQQLALNRIPALPAGESRTQRSDDQPQPRTDRPDASPDGQGEAIAPNTTSDTSSSEVRHWWRRLWGV